MTTFARSRVGPATTVPGGRSLAVVLVPILIGLALGRPGGARELALFVTLVLVGGAVVLRWPLAIFWGSAAAVLLPFPGAQGLRAPVFHGTMYLSDLLLPAAALLACARSRPSKRDLAPAGLALLVVLLGVGSALLYRNPVGALTSELRGPVHVLLGVVIGLAAARDPALRGVLARALGALLWVSALAALVTSLTGLHLVSGPVREVSTNIAGTYTEFDALRFQIAATLAASVLLCVITGLVFLHRDRAMVRSAVLRFGPPSVLLTFLSFSRNSLLALAFAAAFCVVAGARSGRLSHTAVRVATWALLLCVGTAGMLVATDLATRLAGSERNPVEAQWTAYRSRVLDMLGGNKLKQDASASFRREENRYAFAAIRRRPLTGGGFGAAYRPRFRSDAFADERGTRYAHDYYLWVAIKTGIPGLVVTLLLFAWPLARGLGRGRPEQRRAKADVAPLLAGLAGALGTMFVAPLAFAPAFASVFGCLVGFLWGWTGRRSLQPPLWRPRPSPGEQRPDATGAGLAAVERWSEAPAPALTGPPASRRERVPS